MAVEVLTYRPQEITTRKVSRTFDPAFEMARARGVNRLLDPEHSIKRERFLSYEIMQMETHLGERVNVNISRFEYEIHDGQLFGKDMDEPFLESIKSGRDVRRKTGNPVDFAREDAEVEGFSKIQSILSNSETPIGTMMLSISPSGDLRSTYQHNFYDVFTLKEKNGVRFIEARRYTSGLEIEDYKGILFPLANIEIDDDEPAASLLANPIKIQNTLTPDDVHSYLHKNHDSMDERTFDIIKKHCRAVAKEFATSLIDEPENRQKHKDLFDTYLNKAEDIAKMIQIEGLDTWENEPVSISNTVYRDVLTYGRLPVREVMTGCGASGGYEINGEVKSSPFSVIEYAKDKYGERTFECPACKKENLRPYNTLLSRCQHCKSDKVAC